MAGSLKLVTAPEVEPITVPEVRDRLGITDTTSDEVLDALIKAARQFLDGPEGDLGRALNTQTWDLFFDRFPYATSVCSNGVRYSGISVSSAMGIEIPLPPLISVDSVSYINLDGDEVTIDPETYEVDLAGYFGWVIPAADTFWPETMVTVNAVRIRFTAGYGPEGTDVPEPIRQWIAANIGLIRSTVSRASSMVRSETVEGIGSTTWGSGAGDFTAFSSTLNDMLLWQYRTKTPLRGG